MLYLLDASVLITASNLYYPLDRVPEFWGWLRHMGQRGDIKIPAEIMEEIREGRDADLLFEWIRDNDTAAALLLAEDADVALVRRVVTEGYANDLTDDEIEQLGRDPFLISYALVDAENRSVVTTEVSKPGRRRQNRHVPDVCATLGVQCFNTFELGRALNFRTGWNADGR